MIFRRSLFEVRVSISVLMTMRQQIVRGEYVGPLCCTSAEYYGGRLAHLEFVGEIKAFKRWAVASKTMQYLHGLIEDGTEVVFYIEEKA